jgi:hypothetical protein
MLFALAKRWPSVITQAITAKTPNTAQKVSITFAFWH